MVKMKINPAYFDTTTTSARTGRLIMAIGGLPIGIAGYLSLKRFVDELPLGKWERRFARLVLGCACSSAGSTIAGSILSVAMLVFIGVGYGYLVLSGKNETGEQRRKRETYAQAKAFRDALEKYRTATRAPKGTL